MADPQARRMQITAKRAPESASRSGPELAARPGPGWESKTKTTASTLNGGLLHHASRLRGGSSPKADWRHDETPGGPHYDARRAAKTILLETKIRPIHGETCGITFHHRCRTLFFTYYQGAWQLVFRTACRSRRDCTPSHLDSIRELVRLDRAW